MKTDRLTLFYLQRILIIIALPRSPCKHSLSFKHFYVNRKISICVSQTFTVWPVDVYGAFSSDGDGLSWTDSTLLHAAGQFRYGTRVYVGQLHRPTDSSRDTIASTKESLWLDAVPFFSRGVWGRKNKIPLTLNKCLYWSLLWYGINDRQGKENEKRNNKKWYDWTWESARTWTEKPDERDTFSRRTRSDIVDRRHRQYLIGFSFQSRRSRTVRQES